MNAYLLTPTHQYDILFSSLIYIAEHHHKTRELLLTLTPNPPQYQLLLQPVI